MLLSASPLASLFGKVHTENRLFASYLGALHAVVAVVPVAVEHKLLPVWEKRSP